MSECLGGEGQLLGGSGSRGHIRLRRGWGRILTQDPLGQDLDLCYDASWMWCDEYDMRDSISGVRDNCF